MAANRAVKSRIIAQAEFCGKQASGATFHAIIRFKSGNVNTNRSRVRRRSFPPTRPVKVRILYFIFYHQHQAAVHRAVQPQRCSLFPLALYFFYSLPFSLWGFIVYLLLFAPPFSISVPRSPNPTLQGPLTNKSWVAANECHRRANKVITRNGPLRPPRTNSAICCSY